jgi:protein SCO1/2
MRAMLILASLLLIAAAPAEDRAGFDWQQHPGATLPLNVQVRNETGATQALAPVFHGIPVVLDLGYFNCPSLCGLVRANLFDALGKTGLKAGRDFELISLSIDQHETAADAAAAKARDAAAWPGLDPAALHYFTAEQSVIQTVSDAVGFRAKFDPNYREFLHPTGLVLLTGAGAISSYLLGMGYATGDLRAGLVRAGTGGIAKSALPILLLCFHYDVSTGRYTLVIMKLLRLMGILTILTVIGMIVVLNRHGSRP